MPHATQGTDNFPSLRTGHAGSPSAAQLSGSSVPQPRAAAHSSDSSFRTEGQSNAVSIASTGAVKGNHLIHTDFIHVSNYCLRTSSLACKK